LLFGKPLLALAVYAAGSDLHSYVLLIPFVSAYLIYVRRKQLPKEHECSPGFAMVPLLAGLATLGASWSRGAPFLRFSDNDVLTLSAFSFVCLALAGAGLFLGRKWIAAAAFPIAYLFFMVPLPDGVVNGLETASKLASTEVVSVFFNLTGTPVLRDGTVFQLPGIVIEVAQECSGIHSSLVLFITAILASYLMLKSPWRRALLVAVVIPLGIMRNGFRILVIALLCVHVGPHMIHSKLHHQGGPLFFALSLIPLFVMLWWLRKGEVAKQASKRAEGLREGATG